MLTEFDAFPAPGGGGLFDGSVKIAYDITKDLVLTSGTSYLWVPPKILRLAILFLKLWVWLA